MSRTRRPKLGQHFLTDERFRRRLLEALPLEAGDLVLEIGPGRGALTGLLAARARRVVAVERDAGLARELRRRLGDDPALEVVEGDILTADVDEVCRLRGREQCFVFGNLPYYITSPILRHLMGFRRSIRGMALVVQREVADRLVAAPGSRAYGYLTVCVQLYSEPRVLVNVPRGAFSPPPKVESALVGFRMRDRLPGVDDEAFLRFVRRSFAQKRKSLLNNLAAAYPRERIRRAFESQPLGPEVRAEQVSIEQLARLHGSLQEGG